MDRPIAVRAGRPADVPGALAVWAAALEARNGQPPADERRARTLRALTRPDGFLVVATAPDSGPDGGPDSGSGGGSGGGVVGGVVGMAVGMPALADDGAGPPIPGHCHVSAVFVAPDRWGAGIGGRLVDAVLAEAAARGYRTAQLWTQADNERALRLYAGRGFVRSGRAKTEGGEPIVHLTVDRLPPGRDPGPTGGPGVAGGAGG